MHSVVAPGVRSQSNPAAAGARARVAIAGATGYTGQELLRLLARHPRVRITVATASSAASAARRLPALGRIWDGAIVPLDVDRLAAEADVVFLALPDTAAAEIAPGLVAKGVRVIDLSGAFRLRDVEERTRWYPDTRAVPDAVAYGLTEREREAVANASLVANPGCYPTAALLAIAPLADAGVLVAGPDIVIDAKSGVSGAGRTPTDRTHFSEVHGSMSAYGVFGHRHGAEIEQGLGRQVTFTPHLVPLDRGIFATIYLRVSDGTTEDTLGEIYREAYADATFVLPVGAELPQIKHVAHTNFCDIGWRVDPSGRAIVVSVIDNLLKGASGQAVQNMNVLLGLPDATGLL